MEKCYVLFPGKFKPVHSGHIALMEKYINSTDYDVHLTIIISRMSKEGLDPNTSKWFLDRIYAKNPKVTVKVSTDPSPIGTVYNMAGQAEMGEGVYAMGTSAKGGDIKRAEDFVAKFAEGGKYFTPGVEAIFFPVNPEPLMYTGRTDMYADAPVSSTIVRMDIRNNDFASFRTAYLPMIEEGLVNDALLKEYFERLKTELLPIEDNVINDNLSESMMMLAEGGAAGHMDHPYDVEDFTFADLKELVTDLFAGRIQDITEKLDGQNLFASVDEHGNTVFARTPKEAAGIPLSMQDIKTKWLGAPSVQHAFSSAADTINAVFKNISNAPAFFNKPYKKWLNLEIIDTQNFNVIPYVESTISFHEFKKIDDAGEIVPDENNLKNLSVLQAAIDKTNKPVFKAQITPSLIFKKIEQGEQKAKKYIDAIDKMLNKYNLPDDATIANYKVEGLCLHIENSAKLSFLSGDLLNILIKKWVFKEKTENILKIIKTYENEEGRLITKDEYAVLKDFIDNDMKLVFKKIMSPLDNLFMALGNEILKSIQGLMNAGHEKEVVDKLKREIKELTAAVGNTDDEKSKLKIEQSLARLSVVNHELNSTEGVVFDFKGHKLKLTGSFAPLNQLMGVRFKFNKPETMAEGIVIPRRSAVLNENVRTEFDLAGLRKKLAPAIEAGIPTFQIEFSINGDTAKMSPEVKAFLTKYGLAGWKPFDIFGDGSDLGEQVFYNKAGDMYFSLSSNDEDQMYFDTIEIFKMDGEYKKSFGTMQRAEDTEDDEVIGHCVRCGEPLYDGDHHLYCDCCYGEMFM